VGKDFYILSKVGLVKIMGTPAVSYGVILTSVHTNYLDAFCQYSQICLKRSPWGPKLSSCIRQMALLGQIVLIGNVLQRDRSRVAA
jgi:hypothetical protein